MAGSVAGILPLRHDPFKTELAGVPENGLAVVVFHVLVETDTGPGPGDDGYQRGLAHLKRVAAKVVAVGGPRAWA